MTQYFNTRVKVDEQHAQMLQALEYADVLMTLEMCHLLNYDKPSRALKGCASLLSDRIQSKNILCILESILRAPMPVGRWLELRRQCVETAGSFNEFVSMGVEVYEWEPEEEGAEPDGDTIRAEGIEPQEVEEITEEEHQAREEALYIAEWGY